MKTFEDICRMTQPEVKKYMKEYLISNKYTPIDEDGFLYAKGDIPVLLVAHMDTVHKNQCKKIINAKGRMSSPQGIGGDDRCGVFIIMNLVKELKCSVLLCEDEEKGGIGATKFTKATYKKTGEDGKEVDAKYIENLGVNYMVEFDRKGNNDAVFYSCDNKDFIEFVEDMTNFKYATGSFSDISVLMPAAKLAAVNLSSGYYNAHSLIEYVMYDEMMDTIEAAKTLIKEKCDKPFEYVAKKYTPTKYSYPKYQSNYRPPRYYNGPSDDLYYGSLFDSPIESDTEYKDERLANIAMNDTDLELEVIVYGMDMCEQTILVEGATKAECWMNFFIENPRICFNDIVDYSWG